MSGLGGVGGRVRRGLERGKGEGRRELAREGWEGGGR